MNVSLKFAVAKYTPDLRRMEPQNIGLVLWADSGATLCRFLGDDAAKPPKFVTKSDRHAYREWTTYWRHYAAAPGIRRPSGEFVERTSPLYLDVLREKSKEAFRLVDGGLFPDQIPEGEMEDVLGELFARMVERPETRPAQAEREELIQGTKIALEQSGLGKREDLKHDLPIPMKVFGVVRNFTADYAIGQTARPSAVIQHVLLSREQNVDHNALMFDALMRDDVRGVPRENIAALVTTKPNMSNDARTLLEMLKGLVPVIDVSDRVAATKTMAALSERLETAS